ncbi:MAG: EipB family protein [Candidatus Puniceispirillaceae bacterium]
METPRYTGAVRTASVSLAVLALVAAPFSAASAKVASNIVAHKAFYEMEMGDRLQNSHIVNINGRSAFAIERDCSGWRSIEDYMIQFVAENGGSDSVLSHFESWESDSGDKYSFDIMEESSFEGRKDFGGFVQLGEDAISSAFFTMAPDAAIRLPSDTMFPMRHVQNILSNAEAGEKIMGATVFTGAEPDSALMRTSTVVGGWRDVPAADLGSLAEDGYWQINVAYFKPSSTAAEPEYEIAFAMQNNGLVREYEINYGDFSITANLTSAEPVEVRECS